MFSGAASSSSTYRQTPEDTWKHPQSSSGAISKGTQRLAHLLSLWLETSAYWILDSIYVLDIICDIVTSYGTDTLVDVSGSWKHITICILTMLDIMVCVFVTSATCRLAHVGECVGLSFCVILFESMIYLHTLIYLKDHCQNSLLSTNCVLPFKCIFKVSVCPALVNRCVAVYQKLG